MEKSNTLAKVDEMDYIKEFPIGSNFSFSSKEILQFFYIII